MLLRVSALVSCLVLAATADLVAQRSLTRGFNVAVGGNTASLDLGQEGVAIETETGYGIEGRLGYNFIQHLGIFVSGAAAEIQPEGRDNYRLWHAEGGGRLIVLGQGSFFRPYVEASYTVMRSIQDLGGVKLTSNGSGPTAGIGAQLFPIRRLALDLLWKYTYGELDEFVVDGETVSTPDGDTFMRTQRLNLGLVWYP